MSSIAIIPSPRRPLFAGEECEFGRGTPAEADCRAIPAEAAPMDQDTPDEIDSELMRRVAGGDVAAFSELYDRLAGPLFSLALRMLRDEAEAEDLLQEVCVKIWHQSHAYDPRRGTPFAWAVTVLRYKAFDRLRARFRRDRLGDAVGEEAAASTAGADGTEPDGAPDAEQLLGSLGRLPAEQREAIDLAFFQGYTQPEIAARLRQPLGTVKARIRRGLLRLRDLLLRSA